MKWELGYTDDWMEAKTLGASRWELVSVLERRDGDHIWYFKRPIQEEKGEECQHKNTKITEPHLAGARKCLDCGRVKPYGSSREWHTVNTWSDAIKTDGREMITPKPTWAWNCLCGAHMVGVKKCTNPACGCSISFVEGE